MSALMTPRRGRDGRRAKRRPEAAQDSLFAAAVAAPAVPEVAAAAPPAVPEFAPAAPVTAADHDASTTASAHRHGPTLDDLVAGAWEGLLAGAPAACVACGAPMAARHSAGAGVVGGRCGGCGTTLG